MGGKQGQPKPQSGRGGQPPPGQSQPQRIFVGRLANKLHRDPQQEKGGQQHRQRRMPIQPLMPRVLRHPQRAGQYIQSEPEKIARYKDFKVEEQLN